jgi:AraC-like DNA-binding protein
MFGRCCSSKHAFALAVMAGLALLAAGCRSMAPQRGVTGDLHPRKDVAVNTEQARLRIRALVEPLCGTIVASADRISAGTTNRAIRREALLWKIEAVPALREALFRPNPFVALVDTWVLSWQMTDYFKQGRGKQALGDAAPIAVTTCQHLEQRLMGVAVSFTHSGNVTNVRDAARQWAADHPIRHSLAGRESVLSDPAERALRERFSLGEVAVNVGVTLDDLSRRLDIYSAQLFEQSRWQAELFAMDLGEEYQLDQAMPLAREAIRSTAEVAEAVNRMVAPLEKTVAVAETTPQMITKERGATIEALHEEVSRAIEFGQQERIAFIEELTKQRDAALLQLHRDISKERKALTRDVEEISLKAVDRAFYRGVQLAVVAFVVVFASAVLLLFLIRRMFSGKRVTG